MATKLIITAYCFVLSLLVGGWMFVVSAQAETMPFATDEMRLPTVEDVTRNVSTAMGDKRIEIHLDEQKLYAYEGDTVRYAFTTSTGGPGTPTPTGEFQIRNKLTNQLSPLYNIYMDNWMAFTADGLYGIHSLPFWKLANGERLYEGQDHLGTKISNGCVRVSVEESKLLWEWADIGIPVSVMN